MFVIDKQQVNDGSNFFFNRDLKKLKQSKDVGRITSNNIVISRNELCFNLNKKTWEALNVYFSNKLQFERKLYYNRAGLTTRETRMRVVGMRSFIFLLKKEKSLALRLYE